VRANAQRWTGISGLSAQDLESKIRLMDVAFRMRTGMASSEGNGSNGKSPIPSHFAEQWAAIPEKKTTKIPPIVTIQ